MQQRFAALCTLLFPALCLVLFPLSGLAAEPGPAGAIQALQSAITTRDVALMERHINLDKVIGSAVDAVLADSNAIKQAEQTSPAVALVLAGMGSDERVKTVARHLLNTEMKQFVRYGVSSGTFAGTAKAGPHPGAGLFSSLLRGGAGDKKSFGSATVRNQTADTAQVTTSLADATSGETYPLDLALQKQDGVWRVTEITNIHALIKRTVAGSKNKSKGTP